MKKINKGCAIRDKTEIIVRICREEFASIWTPSRIPQENEKEKFTYIIFEFT